MGHIVERRDYGRNHTYRLNGSKAIGVTTAINDGMPKPALVTWGINSVADYALSHWDELGDMGPSEKLSTLKGSPWAERDRAALRGTEIHALAERIVHGEAVEVPEPLIGPVEAYARFLDLWEIEPLATEAVIGHTVYGYAGTGDLWAHVGVRDNMLALIDVKTGKDVYPDAALQLAAYRYANVWQPDGPDSETDHLPDIDLTYVAHVTPDDVRMVPVAADENAFKQFLYCLQTARWVQAHSKRTRDENGDWSVARPLIGDAELAHGVAS